MVAVVLAAMLLLGLSTGIGHTLLAIGGYDRRTWRIKAVLAAGGIALTAGAATLLVGHSAVAVTSGLGACAIGAALLVGGEFARHPVQ